MRAGVVWFVPDDVTRFTLCESEIRELVDKAGDGVLAVEIGGGAEDGRRQPRRATRSGDGQRCLAVEIRQAERQG